MSTLRSAVKALYGIVPQPVRRLLFRGKERYCPVCKTRLRRFYPAGRIPRPNARCPVCGSLERHRLLGLVLRWRTNFFDGAPKRVLHIAPEEALERIVRRLPNVTYLSADLDDPRAMVRMDITDIGYPDGSFDVILCSHVLEHVPDDRKALREFHRVLSPEGWCAIQIPVTDPVTFEDPTIIDPEERLRVFGQRDHVRRYGPDVRDRMEEAGFSVEELTTEEISSEEEEWRMGLMSEDRIYLCKKTERSMVKE